MNRCSDIVRMALFASAAACSMGHGDGVDLGTVESEAKAKPTKDAAVPDSSPTTDASGTPDGNDGGSASGFIDACLLPGMVKATFTATSSYDAIDEGVTAALDLPFPFTLYGVAYSKYWFTTNGQLGFGDTPSGSAFGQVTCPLSDARFTTPIVLVYSTDLINRLDPDTGVCYATTGTAPNRKLVVTWKDSFFYDAWLTSHVTFSATLNEGTNVIDVGLDRIEAPSLPAYETGLVAVLGKQFGGAASSYSCFQDLAPAGTVVHYQP
jgi:hypothetical protein